jgi:hypothetical protein
MKSEGKKGEKERKKEEEKRKKEEEKREEKGRRIRKEGRKEGRGGGEYVKQMRHFSVVKVLLFCVCGFKYVFVFLI